ncbi:MAG: rubrerythrin family protein [Candidatus Aminicenantes bacterium]|nr:rubrerythrin family protein [Candidatus Aminicenantes bacterium]
MEKKCEKNLKDAFAGESQAHMKYLAFSSKADQEGYKNVARLFKANSFAEQVHAVNHLRTLSGIQKTEENLSEAIEGENYEVEKMYPEFIEDAQKAGEKGAERTTSWALAAEKVHAELYKTARDKVLKREDLDDTPIHVCQVCGYTVQAEAPERCPICNSPREKFTAF